MTRKRYWLRLIVCPTFLFCLAAAVFPARAEIIVIGNPRFNVSNLSEQMVSDLYLGRAVQLSTGQRVEVVDLPAGHPAQEEFYAMLNRDPTQIRAYWAKRIFTGKGSPPASRADEAAVIRWVSEAPGRIGYVRAHAVTDSVKVLLRWNKGK